MIDMQVLRQELFNSMVNYTKEANKDGKGMAALIDAAVVMTLSEVLKALDKASK